MKQTTAGTGGLPRRLPPPVSPPNPGLT